MGLLISHLGLSLLSDGMPGIWHFTGNHWKIRKTSQLGNRATVCQGLFTGQEKFKINILFFFCSAEFDETHIFPSVKSKQEGSARIHRANGGLRRRQRRNVLCCALDNGAELKRAEPCDHAKGEPLMCHINPPPLSLASATTMMSSATVKSCNWQPRYMNLLQHRGKFRCVGRPVLMTLWKKKQNTHTRPRSLIWTTWQLTPPHTQERWWAHFPAVIPPQSSRLCGVCERWKRCRGPESGANDSSLFHLSR